MNTWHGSYNTQTGSQDYLWNGSVDYSMHSKSDSAGNEYHNGYGWNRRDTNGDGQYSNQDLYSDSVAIVDYADDNVTPNKATYEVRFRNRVDGNVANQVDGNRAAHLSEVTLRSIIDTNYSGANRINSIFRLQNLYVPVNLVPSGVCDVDCEECAEARAAAGEGSAATGQRRRADCSGEGAGRGLQRCQGNLRNQEGHRWHPAAGD